MKLLLTFLNFNVMRKFIPSVFSLICFFSTVSFGQNYSTGLFNIISVADGQLDGQIDIDAGTNIVTLTLIGQDNRYLAMGFDTHSHAAGKDVVIFDGVDLSDRSFTNSYTAPPLDSQSDWTISTNTVNAGIRTVVATRARNTGDANDYVFSSSPTTLDIVGAIGNSFNIVEHAKKNDAIVSFNLLGIEDENLINFSMAPNPATANVTIVMPSILDKVIVEIFDMLGRKVFERNIIDSHFATIDISTWNSGIYVARISNGQSSQSKRLMKK
jgi:hypothetical protein